MSVVVYSSNDPPMPCKCGTFPKIGMTFYYTSKYTGSLIEGIIGKVGGPLNIVSTNGAMYRNDEIELKPLHVIRSEKLNDLGI
jgi:hypothetical protein